VLESVDPLDAFMLSISADVVKQEQI